jgi:hypothetical protein
MKILPELEDQITKTVDIVNEKFLHIFRRMVAYC